MIGKNLFKKSLTLVLSDNQGHVRRRRMGVESRRPGEELVRHPLLEGHGGGELALHIVKRVKASIFSRGPAIKICNGGDYYYGLSKMKTYHWPRNWRGHYIHT